MVTLCQPAASCAAAAALAEPLAALHIAVAIWSHPPGSDQQWWLWRMVPSSRA